MKDLDVAVEQTDLFEVEKELTDFLDQVTQVAPAQINFQAVAKVTDLSKEVIEACLKAVLL